MSKIKIIGVPPGQAPDWVRNAWVGVEVLLSAAPRAQGMLMGIKGGMPDPRSVGGYEVKLGDAIKALVPKNKQAAEFWEDMFPGQPDRILVFAADVCEVVL